MKNFLSSKSLPSKTKTLSFIIAYAVIFVALMIVGSFWDFDIAKWISKDSLFLGEYFSHNQTALQIEAIGSFPIWLAIGFAAAVLFWLSAQSKYRYLLRVTFSFGCSVVGLVAFYKLFDDTIKYLAEQSGAETILNADTVFGSALGLGFIVWFLCLFATKNLKADKKKLLNLVIVIVCTVALYAVVTAIKIPFGRVRYRAINFLNDPSLFTPWYKINGVRAIEGLPSDSCRSFPSGHTFSAGIICILLCFPYVFESLNTRFFKTFLWVCCIGYVVTVALGRMIAGAHYLTDVVIGGTLSLVGTLVFREIFLAKGQNLTTLKAKPKTNASEYQILN